MLPIYLALFGSNALGLGKPLMAAITLVSVGLRLLVPFPPSQTRSMRGLHLLLRTERSTIG